MADVKQHIQLKGGWNTDDHIGDFPPGDWRDLWDMRVGASAEESAGIAESMLSDNKETYPQSAPTYPTDGSSSKYLGKAADLGNRKIYLFFHTQGGGDDYIVEYNAATGQWAVVLRDENDLLGFDEDYPILDARVLNGVLFWTDNNQQPRQLNITRAKNYQANGLAGYDFYSLYGWVLTYSTDDIVVYGASIYKSLQDNNVGKIPPDEPTWWTEVDEIDDCYPYLDADILDFDARPPKYAPTVEYHTDNSRKTNNIRGKLFQFAYRHIYRDGRRSVFSDASKVAIPQNEEYNNGEYVDNMSLNNFLSVIVYTGSMEVKSIVIIVRNSEDTSTWYKAGTVQMYSEAGERLARHNSYTYFHFYNDIVKTAVSTSDIGRAYHWVPQKCRGLEIIEDNRIIMSNLQEGYDHVNLIVEASVTKQDLGTQPPSFTHLVRGPVPVDIISRTIFKRQVIFDLPEIADPSKYDQATFVIRQYDPDNGWLQASYTFDYTGGETYPDDVKAGLLSGMTTAGMDIATCQDPSDYKICFYEHTSNKDDYTFWKDLDWDGYFYTLDELNKYPILKSGSTKKFGFIYKDEDGRHGGVQTSEELNIYLDAYNETGGGNNIEMDERYRISLAINHAPPSWAVKYSIVFSPDQSVSWYRNFRINTIVATAGNINLQIDIKTPLDDMKLKLPRTQISEYSWQKGDRLRFVARMSGGSPLYFGKYLDFEIEKVEEDEEAGTQSLFIKYFDKSPYGFNVQTIVEIYRPSKVTQEAIFYDTGVEFDVLTDQYGNKYHEGDTTQEFDSGGDLTTPGQLWLDSVNDGYKWPRFDGTITYWVEEMNYSDFERPGDMYSLGFPKVEEPDMVQKVYHTLLRWGGPLYSDTNVNELCTFDYANKEYLPEVYGSIQRAILVGFTLKCILTKKVYSLYIKRMLSTDAEGNEQLILTSNIIGMKRPEAQDWGTQNPESVCKYNQWLFWWDRVAGKFIWDAGGGMIALSDRKVTNFFNDLSHNYPNYTMKCVVGFNAKFGELWVTWKQGVLKTIVFSMKRGRWIGNINTVLDDYITIGTNFYSVYHGQMYQKNDENAGYLEYAVNTGQPKFKVIGNIDEGKIKIWKALAIYASNKFYNDGWGITVPANVSYPDGMRTRLKKNLLEDREGVYYGPIMMDELTPMAGSSEAERVVNGRPLRGEQIEIELYSDQETEEQVFFEGMIIHATPSERSKQ